MAPCGGAPADSLDGAAVWHVVVLERQRVGDPAPLGVVRGKSAKPG